MTTFRSDQPEAPAKFKRGDLVRWTSQGRGREVHRVGVVILEVPAGVPIGTLLPGLAARFSLRAMRNATGSRSSRSYLVARTDVRGAGRARLHWPHAAQLQPYSGER